MATVEELVTRFRAAWSGQGPRRAPTGEAIGEAIGEPIDEAVAARLTELCDEAHRVHPEIAVDDGELIEAIAARAPEPAGELAAYLARCRAGDLVLALAAGRGSPGAIAELERAYRATLDAVVRRFAGAVHTADDLRQILRTRLFVAEPGGRPKIADYAGQGFLENWLRVTAVRVFLDLDKRKDRAREQPADEDDVLALPGPGDLALDVVKAEYRAAFATAMHDAAQQLLPGDRHLLRQHFVAGLSIDQLGSALGIHRATAARRIAKARELLVATTRQLLAERLALDAGELDEAIGLVISRLDVSIARMLASGAPA